MADEKLTALADATAIADTDLVAMVKGMGTTPTTVSRAWSLLKSTFKTYLDTLYPDISAQGGYALSHTHFATTSTFAPGDAQTYYYGHNPGQANNTTANVSRVYIPKSGTITKVRVNFRNYAVDGSAETSTVYLRLNNSTDTTLSSAVATNGFNHFVDATVSITVSAGDYYEIKWVTPTWATNPTQLALSVTVFIN